MLVAVQTHGCRLNRSESDAMAALLRQAGHEIVDDPSTAEVVVLNTCTITHRADADARRATRRLQRSGARVVLTGCFVDADPGRAAQLSGVAAVLGNADKAEVVAAVGHAGSQSAAPLVSVRALTRRMPMTQLAAAASGRARALLKIQDGCNYACAFCIVPSVRGGSRSLPPEQITEQLQSLLAQGSPEIVLTGIHLGTWGRDLRPRQSIGSLVARLVPQLGSARLRLSSIDPHEIDDALLATMRDNPARLCPHLHLPVQSGDDATLRAMRRGHDCADFVRAVTSAAAHLPCPGLGTDVIVGFPGEDEAAFARTEAKLAALPLTYLHVFPFSRRRGTPAATMPGQLTPETIARRAKALRALSARKAAAFRAANAGRIAMAVVNRKPAATTWPALCANYLQVDLDPKSAAPVAGKLVHVRIAEDGRTAAIVD